MKRGCPYCHSTFVKKNGFFFRRDDSRSIQRFKCHNCKRGYSAAIFGDEYKQKKRRKNQIISSLLASGVSQRRIAKIIGYSRTTIARKFLYLAKKARKIQGKFIEQFKLNKIMHLQIDDLITSEHTKLKPISVSVAVDGVHRYALAAIVSQIPAFGHLSKISKKKYGRRKNHHKQGLEKLFERIQDKVDKNALIKTDEHKSYPEFIQKYFPHATHKQYKSIRGCVTGQGELKRSRRDPLFTINHTLAMLRANINRLFRRTWCTTKDRERLQDHLDIFLAYFNTQLV